ncbi:MAG: hypothetical protein ACLTBL_02665 [Clostridium sp.]
MALAARTVTAFRQRRFSYEDWLIFCFGAGIIGGTAVVLLFGEGALGRGLLAGEGREDLWGKGMISCLTETLKDGGLEQAMKEAGVVSLLAKRLLQMTAGWVAGLTICSPFFLLHYLLGRNVPFRGLGFSHIGKGRLGTSSVSLAFVSTGGDLWDYLGSPCRLGRRTGTPSSSGSFFSSTSFYRSRSSVRGDFSSPVMFSALLFQKPAKELTEVGICGLGL